MSDGTTSPPYPSGATNSRMLYRHLMTLRDWVNEQAEILKPLVPSRFSDYLDEHTNLKLESEAFWENVSVVDKHTILTWIRQIRESWDVLLRHYEDAWDSRYSLQQRYNVVVTAIRILSQAFVDPETREHQNAIAADKARKKQKMIDDHLKDILVPEALKNEQPSEPSDQLTDDDWLEDQDPENPEDPHEEAT